MRVWVVLLWLACWSPGAWGLECLRVQAELPEGWITLGAWSSDGREVLVGDHGRGVVLRLGLDGRVLGNLHQADGSPLDIDKPTSIQETPEGYLIQDGVTRWVFYDPAFRPLRTVESQGSPPSLYLIRQVLHGSQFVGWGRTGHPASGWTDGFLEVSTENLIARRVVQETPVTARGWSLYGMHSPLLARVGERAFGLVYDEPPYLLEIVPEPRRLQAFPAGFETLPSLPESRGPETTVVRYHALARTKVADSLYGQGTYLYLLTREPRSGATDWRLHQIDPARDVLVRTLVLPTSAPHLRILPGEREWVVFEGGPVVGPGQQKIESLLRIPSAWVEDPEDQTLQGEPVVCS